MASPDIARIYANDWDRTQALSGAHPFLTPLADVLGKAGLAVDFLPDDATEHFAAAARDEYSLFWMQPPTHPRGLTFRRSYLRPFWTIEQQAERWLWPVARARFDPSAVDSTNATRFAARWRETLFGANASVSDKGYVYIPLQGRLLSQRSFQAATPIEMIEAVLRHEPERAVVAALHPGESYSAAELSALDALVAAHPRLSLATSGMAELLAHASYVVTQNSSVAFKGYLLRKPAVLFGRIDFHHIAANVHDTGAERAISAAPGLNPDFDAYILWFLQRWFINTRRDTVHTRIERKLRNCGWPV